jgi:hypothetical protein
MGKIIVLIVSIMMPRDVPDVRHVQQMESFETCWEGAKDFLAHDLSDEMRTRGAIGMSAACAYQELPSQKN